MEYVVGADSECSSGCESGWTLYFDNSSVSHHENGDERCEFRSIGKERTEVEEDMSMVSDASSGPPHFAEEDETLWKQRGKKQRLKENKKAKRRDDARVEKSSVLDDTASSPVFNPPNQKNYKSEAVLDVSKGYSTTQFQMQGNSAYQEEYQPGYFQYPSLSGNYMQQNQWFAGSVWQP